MPVNNCLFLLISEINTYRHIRVGAHCATEHFAVLVRATVLELKSYQFTNIMVEEGEKRIMKSQAQNTEREETKYVLSLLLF